MCPFARSTPAVRADAPRRAIDRRTISAAREVRHAPARVYAFLAHLDNHWHLGGRALRVSTLDAGGRGGRILVAAPLGLRRTARTALTSAHEPHLLGGVARVGRNTRAYVQWSVEPTARGARVALESTIYRTGAVDRSLLALGGRWWLRRAFRRTLAILADALDGATTGHDVRAHDRFPIADRAYALEP